MTTGSGRPGRARKALLRNGEYRVIMPGLRMMIPGVHKLARIHVRQRTINFPEQTIVFSESTVFDIGAVLMCRVKDSPIDLYNALFETTGIDEALTDYGLLVVRGVLGGKQYEDVVGHNREAISAELMSRAQDKAAEWGVEILSFELSDCRPNDQTARLIQTSAGVVQAGRPDGCGAAARHGGCLRIGPRPGIRAHRRAARRRHERLGHRYSAAGRRRGTGRARRGGMTATSAAGGPNTGPLIVTGEQAGRLRLTALKLELYGRTGGSDRSISATAGAAVGQEVRAQGGTSMTQGT